MTESVSCPDPNRWEALLSEELPPEEQSALAAHLATCASCQQTLESLAADSETWFGAAQHLGAEGHGGEPALQRVVGELEGNEVPPPLQAETQLNEEESLDFLTPSQQPGLLGRLGHYEVLTVIGRGGMGVVLKAFDPSLQRVVAIKVLASHLATSALARRRFIREAQAAAAVRNEHVIDIHAVEGTGDRPYFVMEYISGLSLQQRLDQTGSLEIKEILRIGIQVAAGLAAAHAQGLVHRDIKPANILLEDGIERVKLTDFGLARAVDDTSLTQSGVVAGTPQYMASEQARGEAVDHRADLFSLGSVLYAMCTGHPPFQAPTTLAVLKQVGEDTPRPIEEINAQIPEWLCAIITRLHAKDPYQRLQSATEVADLLSAHLAPLPHTGVKGIRPVPQSSSRSRRRWRVVAVPLILLLGGLTLTEATGMTKIASAVIRVLTAEGTLVVEVEDPNVKVTIEGDGDLVITGAGAQEVRLRPGRYCVQAAKDGKPIQTEVVTIARGDKEVIRVNLESAGRARSAFEFKPPPPGPLDRLDAAKIPASERFAWQPKELVAVLGEHRRQPAISTCVAISPDGKRVASCGWERAVYVWDAETVHLRTLLLGHMGFNWSVAFSPDGGRLLSGGEDQTMRLWDLETGRELRCFRGHSGKVGGVAYSPDGRRALSGGDDRVVHLWDLETGKELARFQGHTGSIHSVAFSPDGSQALSGSTDKTMRLWKVETGKELRCFQGHTEGFRNVVFLPSGCQALSCSHDMTLRLWDVQTGQELRRFEGHTGHVYSLAVSRDGRRALSGGGDGTIRLWDMETGQEQRRMTYRLPISSVVFSPDGRRAVSFGWDGFVRLWDLESGEELNPPQGFRERYQLLRISFSPEGERVLVSSRDNFMRLWDVVSGRELRRFELPHTIWGVGFSTDGCRVLGAGQGGGNMALWDAENGQKLRRFAEADGLWDAALSRDDRRIVTGANDGTIRLWDFESGRELNCFRGHKGGVHTVALAPDGRRAVSGSRDGTVRLWDLETGRERHPLRERGAVIYGVAFSPNGRCVAAGDNDGSVQLWDVTGPEPRWRPLPKWHTGSVRGVAFAPDARTLASAGLDGRIVIWDVATGSKRREWQLPGGIEGIAFAADSRHLAAANGNGTVYVLRLSTP